MEIKNTTVATQIISAHPEIFDDYEVLKGNMDSVFLRVTGKDIREAQL